MTASVPPPPLCNRVANCGWSTGGSSCRCEEWPQWLANHGRSALATAIETCEGNVLLDPVDAVSLPTKRGSFVSYYRPSGTASS